jgi:Dyp-type peroxidase family
MKPKGASETGLFRSLADPPLKDKIPLEVRSLAVSRVNIKSSNGMLWGLVAGLAGYALYQLLQESEETNVQAAEAPPKAELAQSTAVTGTHPAGGFAIITLTSKADLDKVAAACAKLPDLIKDLTPDEKRPKDALPPVMAGVAFGTQLWDKLTKNKKGQLPQNFGHYKERKGKHGKMPETGGDILIHSKCESQSLCWEVIKALVDSLPAGSVAKVDDQYGFQYQDGRDLSGFLDGTENVADPIARRQAALLPTGGSYVIHQRWLHDLKGLHSKSLEDQETIFGRSKPDSAEASILPKNSHVARMRDDAGNKIPIVRQSMPFGTVGDKHGLLFIAYSNSPAKFDTMLDRMVGKTGGADNDATMTFSTCVASNYYYMPSLKELQSLK